MPQDIQFDLIDPERRVTSGVVQLAVMPGEEGDFGVGTGHMPLVSALRPGVVHIRRDWASDAPDDAWFITAGYADVDGNHCTVLADSVEPMSALNGPELQQELANLHEDMMLYEGDEDRARVTKEIALIREKLRAVKTFAEG